MEIKDLENKIINADCLDILKQLPDKCIDMILCDLPYGTTSCKWDTVIPLELLWKKYNRIIKNNGIICLFGVEPFSSKLRLSNLKMYKYDWIWEKTKYSNFLCLKKQPAKNFENICIFYKKQPTYNPQMLKGKPYSDKRTGVKKQGRQQEYGIKKFIPIENNGYRFPNSIIKFNNGNNKTIHPTQKPVALFEYLVNTYTNENDLVLDNCSGSGTTAIACMHTNRRFICIEKDKDYYEASVKRLGEEQRQLDLLDIC